MSNPDVAMTLRECVDEVLGLLTGLDLTYDPEMDRFRSITRQLNRALRSNALEKEWSYYASTENLGLAVAGEQHLLIRPSVRPRIINDDAVRLVDATTQHPVKWAYFLPRDAIHKQPDRTGLWASVLRNTLTFSRPFHTAEAGLEIHLPVMREPEMFRLPEVEGEAVPDSTLNQELDFWYPDVVILRAAMYYAMTDPVMQPRVQTLEAMYKDLFYQLNERDDRNTDSPTLNEWNVPINSSIRPMGHTLSHRPTADERR